jgi:hypothetical protein
MIALLVALSSAILTPNGSLATTPTGYFGGNAAHRDNSSIAMLAKARIVMIEKWEGHCWQDCLKGGAGSSSCQASCDGEASIMDTLARVKAINPGVCAVFYLNTMLSFPFYALNGVLQAANALTIDSVTKKPIVVRNDNGMEGIFILGFDTPQGQKLYVDAVRNLTRTGVVDGFFGDKWNSGAQPAKNGSGWEICNHECGAVTAAQGRKWNRGKAKVLAEVIDILGDGPYYANHDVFKGDPATTVPSNFYGTSNARPGKASLLTSGDPRQLVDRVQLWLHGDNSSSSPPHKYVYVASCRDENWRVDPNDPASQAPASHCVGDCHARFLLAVEENVFLGTNGYSADYDRPLGDPKGPAVFNAGGGDGEDAMPTLTREFGDTGTKVVFTYNSTQATEGKGVIFWNGVPPPAPD